MEFQLEFKKSVIKDLQKLQKDTAKEIVTKIKSNLSSEALKQPQLKGRFKGMRRYRVGNYRVIFTMNKDRIIILRIADRKDIYNN